MLKPALSEWMIEQDHCMMFFVYVSTQVCIL